MKRPALNLHMFTFVISAFADQLGHGSHGTVYAPAAGLKKHHGNQSQYGRGKHNAVKSEGKLSCAGMKQGSMICPVPRELKGPQKGHSLF